MIFHMSCSSSCFTWLLVIHLRRRASGNPSGNHNRGSSAKIFRQCPALRCFPDWLRTASRVMSCLDLLMSLLCFHLSLITCLPTLLYVSRLPINLSPRIVCFSLVVVVPGSFACSLLCVSSIIRLSPSVAPKPFISTH